jgi:putative tricarboxylic transport membrane protein
VPVPILVINKPGAGGVIAQNYLNSFGGSGNHLMVTNPALVTNQLTGTGNISYTEVTPVAQLFTESIVLIVGGKSRFRSTREVLDILRKDPGSLTVGVAPTVGAGTHIGMAMAVREAGIEPAKLQIIPYATAA